MAAAFPILFISPPGAVNALLASGLVKRLTEEIPHGLFTIAADAGAEALFRDMPRLERFIPLGEGRGGRFSLWGQVRGRRWGLVVDVAGGLLGGMISARTRALYKQPRLDAAPAHKVQDWARVLKLEDDPPAPALFVGSHTSEQARAMVGASEPILALAPGADWIGRVWPAERFNEVAARLLGPDCPLEGGSLLIVGSETDREMAQTVRAAVPRDRVIDLTGRVDPLVAYACLRSARLLVGNDGLYTHLAAAADIPTLGLFGPSDEVREGPWGAHARVVRGHRAFADFLIVDRNLDQALNHMLDLPVEAVLDAAQRLLKETEPELARAV